MTGGTSSSHLAMTQWLLNQGKDGDDNGDGKWDVISESIRMSGERWG